MKEGENKRLKSYMKKWLRGCCLFIGEIFLQASLRANLIADEYGDQEKLPSDKVNSKKFHTEHRSAGVERFIRRRAYSGFFLYSGVVEVPCCTLHGRSMK